MKKWLSLCLLPILLLTAVGCAFAEGDGYLFLTVSDLTLTLVGDQEDIYIGSIPADQVQWSSEDPSVVSVENGVVTAAAVGSTTITGTYGEQSVSCRVGCLAESKEALETMHLSYRRSPKRFPFQVDQWPQSFYDDSAFIGDSITYTLWHTAGKKPDELMNALWLVRGGTSINGFVRGYKNIYYQGVEMMLDEAVALSCVKKIFLMLGQNDLGYMTIEDTMANWEKLLGAILEKSPEVEVYIQSLVPEWLPINNKNTKNEKIVEYNQQLKTYCDENGYHFIEIAAYIEDHTGRMADVYSMDQSIHVNYDGTAVWMEALKAYARLQELQGEYA